MSLAEWSQKKINAIVKSRTIEATLALNKSEGIQSFGKMNQEFVKSVLAMWIMGLNEFLYGNEPQKALTEGQIEATCDLLTEMPEFRNITIADLSLVFRKAYAGEYGKLYGRIRPDVIIDWFVNYFNDRCNMAANLNQAKDQGMKRFLANVPRQSVEVESMREGMKKALKHKSRSEELDEAKKGIDKAKQQSK